MMFTFADKTLELLLSAKIMDKKAIEVQDDEHTSPEVNELLAILRATTISLCTKIVATAVGVDVVPGVDLNQLPDIDKSLYKV